MARAATRSAPLYSNEVHGQGNSRIPKGDCTINAKVAKVEIVMPQYEKGPMVFRPLPALDYQDTSRILPGRLSLNRLGQGGWLVHSDLVSYFGVKGNEMHTYIPYLPWAQDDEKNSNPASVLYWAAWRMKKEYNDSNGKTPWQPIWNKLFDYQKDTGKQMKNIGRAWWMAAKVFINGEKDFTKTDRPHPLGLGPDDVLTVVRFPESFSTFVDFMDTKRPLRPGEALPDDVGKPWLNFKYGDVTGLYDEATKTVKGGLIITGFNPKKMGTVPPNTTWDGVAPDPKEVAGYEFAVAKTFSPRPGKVYTSDLDARETELVKQRVKFWWDDATDPEQFPGLLRVPSLEEQYVMIAKGFKTHRALLELCLADHTEFFTEDVNAILSARTGVVMPGDTGTPPAAATRTSQVDPTTRGAAQRPTAAARRPAPAAAPVTDEFDSFVDEVPAAETELPAEEFVDQPADEFVDGPPADGVLDEGVVTDDEFLADGQEATEYDTPAATDADLGEFADGAGEAAATDEFLDELPAEEPEAGGEAGGDDFGGEAVDAEPAQDEQEAEMAAAMAAARARSAQRSSTQVARPPAAARSVTAAAPAAARPVAARPVAAAAPAAAPAAARPVASRPVAATAPARPAGGRPTAAGAPARPVTAAPARPKAAPAAPAAPAARTRTAARK